MADTYYTTITWTAGDVITEAKLDNMVANDRAVDAMAQGVEFTERADPSTPGTNKVHVYAKDKSGVPTLYAINDAGTVYEISEFTPGFGFQYPGSLLTGTLMTPPWGAMKSLTITKIYGFVNVAPTGAAIIIDTNKNGTSIWNVTPANRLTIAIGATSGSQTSFDTTTLVENDTLTFDIDQIGSTVAGSDLTIQVKAK